MPRSLLTRSLISGTVSGILTSAALLGLARMRGIPVWRSLNCTAHWLDGPKTAENDALELRQTGVGFGTNHAACIFWAGFVEAALGGGRVSWARAAATAATVTVIAVPADYIATPKRFTPGWELVFRVRDIALVYAAMAIGLTLGARLTHRDA